MFPGRFERPAAGAAGYFFAGDSRDDRTESAGCSTENRSRSGHFFILPIACFIIAAIFRGKREPDQELVLVMNTQV